MTNAFASLVSAAVVFLICCAESDGYALLSVNPNYPYARWKDGTVTFHFRPHTAPFPLADGTTSYAQAFQEAAGKWNAVMGRLQISVVVESPSNPRLITPNDGIPDFGFTTTFFGFAWNGNVVGTQLIEYPGDYHFYDADTAFNGTTIWDVYHGPLAFQASGAYLEFRRVAVQQIGRALGLLPPDEHGQTVKAIMNSKEYNLEDLQADDIAGVQALYGANAATGGTLGNISTRVYVGTGDNVAIAGFIIQGGNTVVVIRGIGPSLTQYGVKGALQNPVLELHDSTGAVIETNDSWQGNVTEANALKSLKLNPQSALESAIYRNLPPGNYTAIMRGAGGSTGVGLVEVYTVSGVGKIGNISTRGNVLTGDSVMIGGFIVKGGNTILAIRAIGPELTQYGVSGALQDTTLELHNAQGALVQSNDDWKSDVNAGALQTSGMNPKDDRESAMRVNLPAGSYTAIVRGKNSTTGVGLVEVYRQ